MSAELSAGTFRGVVARPPPLPARLPGGNADDTPRREAPDGGDLE